MVHISMSASAALIGAAFTFPANMRRVLDCNCGSDTVYGRAWFLELRINDIVCPCYFVIMQNILGAVLHLICIFST